MISCWLSIEVWNLGFWRFFLFRWIDSTTLVPRGTWGKPSRIPSGEKPASIRSRKKQPDQLQVIQPPWPSYPPASWRVTILSLRWTHHPKKVTIAELPASRFYWTQSGRLPFFFFFGHAHADIKPETTAENRGVESGGAVKSRSFFYQVFWKIWAIYNDLSRGHPKWWFSKGIPSKMALN